jgi:hypothetical protein
VFRHACKLGFEGIVSKRKDSAYREEPAFVTTQRAWMKRSLPPPTFCEGYHGGLSGRSIPGVMHHPDALSQGDARRWPASR